MGDWARAAEHNSEKTGSLCRNTESAKQKFAHFQTNSCSAHRFKWVIAVMPYITVRNKSNMTTIRPYNLFERTLTYIDYQGTYQDTIGLGLVSRLSASCDLTRSSDQDKCSYWTDKPPHVVFNVPGKLGVQSCCCNLY